MTERYFNSTTDNIWLFCPQRWKRLTKQPQARYNINQRGNGARVKWKRCKLSGAIPQTSAYLSSKALCKRATRKPNRFVFLQNTRQLSTFSITLVSRETRRLYAVNSLIPFFYVSRETKRYPHLFHAKHFWPYLCLFGVFLRCFGLFLTVFKPSFRNFYFFLRVNFDLVDCE